MRTERRHELQTNALADWIGSKTQQVQPYSRVVVGAVIAVAVVIFAIGYRARTNSAARAAGCQTANGLGMLLHQGAKSLEIWSGQAVPLDVMRAALKEAVHGG